MIARMQVWLYALCILGLVVNLLVPAQVLRYGACCYDDQGLLKAGASCCGDHATQFGRMADPDSCCLPKVLTLRPAPAAPVLHSDVARVGDFCALSLAAAAPLDSRIEHVAELGMAQGLAPEAWPPTGPRPSVLPLFIVHGALIV